MFSLQIDLAFTIWHRILETYCSPGSSIIDFTYGTGSLWKNVPNIYNLTKCDAQPSTFEQTKLPGIIHQKNILTDTYDGIYDYGLFDPPYMFGKSRNISKSVKSDWTRINVNNKNPDEFNARVLCLNEKAKCVNKLLFVKILDPRYKGKIYPHHNNIINMLTNFNIVDIIVYLRLGATTFTVKQGTQNLHGYWMVFERK